MQGVHYRLLRPYYVRSWRQSDLDSVADRYDANHKPMIPYMPTGHAAYLSLKLSAHRLLILGYMYRLLKLWMVRRWLSYGQLGRSGILASSSCLATIYGTNIGKSFSPLSYAYRLPADTAFPTIALSRNLFYISVCLQATILREYKGKD